MRPRPLSSGTPDKTLELNVQIRAKRVLVFQKVAKFKTLPELNLFGLLPEAKTLELKCLNLGQKLDCTLMISRTLLR